MGLKLSVSNPSYLIFKVFDLSFDKLRIFNPSTMLRNDLISYGSTVKTCLGLTWGGEFKRELLKKLLKSVCLFGESLRVLRLFFQLRIVLLGKFLPPLKQDQFYQIFHF